MAFMNVLSPSLSSFEFLYTSLLTTLLLDLNLFGSGSCSTQVMIGKKHISMLVAQRSVQLVWAGYKVYS